MKSEDPPYLFTIGEWATEVAKLKESTESVAVSRAEGADGGRGSRQRHADFTKDMAAALGAAGGRASGVVRRRKKLMREIMQDVLGCKITDDEANERLRRAGYVRASGRGTVRLAVAANMARLAMSEDTKEAVAAVKAATLITQIEAGEIGRVSEKISGADGIDTGGVAILTEVDMGLLDAMSAGDAPTRE